jgi:hypothetical protein
MARYRDITPAEMTPAQRRNGTSERKDLGTLSNISLLAARSHEIGAFPLQVG